MNQTSSSNTQDLQDHIHHDVLAEQGSAHWVFQGELCDLYNISHPVTAVLELIRAGGPIQLDDNDYWFDMDRADEIDHDLAAIIATGGYGKPVAADMNEAWGF